MKQASKIRKIAFVADHNALADHATSFVTVQLDEVLAGMQADYPPTSSDS